MNKLTELKKKIQEEIPEIMELKFGCEMLRISPSDASSNYKVIEDRGFASNDKKCWINSVPFGFMPIEIEKDLTKYGGEFEILGRPITLEDVLRVLLYTNNFSCGIDNNNIGEFSNGESEIASLICYWQLGETLDDQSEELINFLYQLICK